MSWLFFGAIVLLWVFLTVLLRQSYRRGAAETKIEQHEKRSAALQRAALVRDRLVRDADFARRVRDRFRR